MNRLVACLTLCGVLMAACGIDGAPRPPKAVAAERQADGDSSQTNEPADEYEDEVFEEPTDDV